MCDRHFYAILIVFLLIFFVSQAVLVIILYLFFLTLLMLSKSHFIKPNTFLINSFFYEGKLTRASDMCICFMLQNNAPIDGTDWNNHFTEFIYSA